MMACSHTKRVCVTVVFSLLLFRLPLLRAQATSSTTTQASSQNDRARLANVGRDALNSGNYAVAEKNYNTLLKLGVHSPLVYSNLGVVYMRTGRFDRAI